MTNKEYVKNLTIWCSYHNDALVDEYNLNYIPSYIKLFNTNDLLLPKDNINYLNPHLNEICAFYYVWKNQIYSKYVGFCHYRRFFFNLGKNNIEKYKVHYYGSIPQKIKDINEDYIKKLFKYLNQIKIFDTDTLYKYFYENTIINMPLKISFIFTWDMFNKVCEIYFGFLEYLLPDFKNIKHYKDTGRHYGWMSEIIIGIIISLLYNNIELYDTNWNVDYDCVKQLVTCTNSMDAMDAFIKKNNRTGTPINVISDNIKKEILCSYTYEYVNIYESKDQLRTDNYIELDINEYVKCVDPIEYNKGNYTIEKF